VFLRAFSLGNTESSRVTAFKVAGQSGFKLPFVRHLSALLQTVEVCLPLSIPHHRVYRGAPSHEQVQQDHGAVCISTDANGAAHDGPSLEPGQETTKLQLLSVGGTCEIERAEFHETSSIWLNQVRPLGQGHILPSTKNKRCITACRVGRGEGCVHYCVVRCSVGALLTLRCLHAKVASCRQREWLFPFRRCVWRCSGVVMPTEVECMQSVFFWTFLFGSLNTRLRLSRLKVI
jgi:hypothetical protein